ncbi:tetratricopeptide repeat protein [Reichenbachiella ulvae]|uniref:Tetratricopeptide repeat-containing protein n=1 Tax=Reichenbachiella ulvae TaxID=2980104 RepID=A0ABT3CTG4_9BACT|nr:hypothetical protein [Reichenbachiella ulvae]MCV9386982.1 hypothetical protein [Reichenbachiella ulvae]
MKHTEDIVKIIQAIGGIWPLLLSICFIIAIIKKWNWIWDRFDNVKKIKVKSGNNEFEVETNGSSNKKESLPEIEKVTEELDENESKEEEQTLFDCYTSLKQGERKKAEEIFSQVQKKASKEVLYKNEIVFLFYKHLSGDPTVIDNLKKRLDDSNLGNSDRLVVLKFIAKCYSDLNNVQELSTYFDKALELAQSDSEKSSIVLDKFYGLKEANEIEKGRTILINFLPSLNDNNEKAKLLHALSDTYEGEEEIILRLSTLEKAVSLVPNNVHLLFSLAFDLAKYEYKKESINSYLKLLQYTPKNANALNNIGSGFKSVEMNNYAVEYYKRAKEENHTLAIGNLCFQFINAGFLDEAQEIIDYHKTAESSEHMIIKAQDEILNIKRRRKEDFNNIAEKGRSFSEFLLDYSNQQFENNIPVKYDSNDWRTDHDEQVTISIDREILTIVWKDKHHFNRGTDDHTINAKINNRSISGNYRFPQSYLFKKSTSLTVEDKKYQEVNGHISLNIDNGTIRFLNTSNDDFQLKVFNLKNA